MCAQRRHDVCAHGRTGVGQRRRLRRDHTSNLCRNFECLEYFWEIARVLRAAMATPTGLTWVNMMWILCQKREHLCQKREVVYLKRGILCFKNDELCSSRRSKWCTTSRSCASRCWCSGSAWRTRRSLRSSPSRPLRTCWVSRPVDLRSKILLYYYSSSVYGSWWTGRCQNVILVPVCFEMFIAAVCHHFIFPANQWVKMMNVLH